jgi:hypothetical protein
VGSPDDERIGLTRDQVREIQKRYPGKTIPGNEYRDLRDHPLLIVNVIWPYERPRDSKDKEARDYLPPNLRPIVALSLSLPAFDDRDVKVHLEYQVNNVYWQSILDELGDDFEVGDVLD